MTKCREAVRLAVLGPMEVWRGSAMVEVAAAKHRAVLALLAIGGNRPVHPDRLISELWRAEPPKAPRKTLQGYVWRLRAQLGAGNLRTTTGGYQLVIDPGAIDAGRFEAALRTGQQHLRAGRPGEARSSLRSALDLWRGPVLVDVVDVPAVDAYAARLEESRLLATELLMESELELGRHAELVPVLRELVSHHPLREALSGHLMVALFRCGRQADALAVFADLRAGLAREQGLDPNRSVRELQRRILAGDPALELP